jgi:hypothetical protein
MFKAASRQTAAIGATTHPRAAATGRAHPTGLAHATGPAHVTGHQTYSLFRPQEAYK